MIVPVILSGGSGTRLWPLSRKMYPKQLLSLTGEHSLLQETALRSSMLKDAAPPVVVCNESYRFMVAEQLRRISIEPDAIFLEPEGRNSAPAITAAAFHVQQKYPDAAMLVMPSDHVLTELNEFGRAVERGLVAAKQNRLVLFGIAPDRPETGYGYICINRGLKTENFCPAAGFVEKPDAATAAAYVESGKYLWNAGIFLFSPTTFLETLEKLEPEIHNCCREAVIKARSDLDFIRLDPKSFSACPSKSVDYAVMEKTDNLCVVPFSGSWSDIGSWDSLMRERKTDEAGNVITGDVVASNVTDSFLHSSGRLIGVVGMQNVVVVETADAVLVADRNSGQEVSQLVETLRRQGREEVSVHRRVYRPWGTYETVDNGERFQVKRIVVKPGGVLSLQMHHHRAEHWIVVKGTAKVTIGDAEIMLREDQSTYIPLGTKHRLLNPGKINLELIEVQTGSYLGEDDIQRFEDVYGRSED
ncbi:mannose-1-phosphate guanylyltransferase/mannose-6-phosphate isomerase [Maridesulfovibrio sp.]|uniref:mannose-1-phosphate guanylyltransferase/mannose-6-phosphate isomerase n=1 Tax=Maridesulfovibrio sp. TaxID=2795000 RepID=UPI002A18DBCA|nr:mannose-1-phosphate guanylyltransferase/mannose-6-phosphate isomerase [Maridesulfovibrio sp.]